MLDAGTDITIFAVMAENTSVSLMAIDTMPADPNDFTLEKIQNWVGPIWAPERENGAARQQPMASIHMHVKKILTSLWSLKMA